jgi:hypothetical protein
MLHHGCVGPATQRSAYNAALMTAATVPIGLSLMRYRWAPSLE